MAIKFTGFNSEAATGVLKKGFLKYFAKFTGKHLCQSLFFNKVVGLRSCEFCEFFKDTFLTE